MVHSDATDTHYCWRNSYAWECDLYSAIPNVPAQNFPIVPEDLLKAKSVVQLPFENLRMKSELLGLRSWGIPPRNTLHDNDGGRIEKIRGRTGNGEVQIKPGCTLPKCPSINAEISHSSIDRVNIRVAWRRSWAAACFKRWSWLWWPLP